MLTVLSHKTFPVPVLAVTFALAVLAANGNRWWSHALSQPVVISANQSANA